MNHDFCRPPATSVIVAGAQLNEVANLEVGGKVENLTAPKSTF